MRAVSRVSLALAACCLLGTSGALAQTDIRFQLPEMDGGLQDAILSSSLLADAVRNETTDIQELLADGRADYQRILSVLYANGYFGGIVNIFVDRRELADISPLETPQNIGGIVVRVLPGRLYTFGTARVAPIAPGTEMPPEFANGEPAEIGTIQRAANAAVEGWRNAGHAKVEITGQEITARHDIRRVDASVDLAPGPQLRFGTVSVTGNEDVSAQRILAIAGLEEGRVYSPKVIARTEERLRRTGTFRSARVAEADEIGEGNTLPMTIEVSEQIPRRFGFGADYETDEGFGVSGFWLHRNFLGGAERLRVEGKVKGIAGNTGGLDVDLGVRFERPATPRSDTDFFIGLSVDRLNEPDFIANTARFNTGFVRYATEDLTLEYGVGLIYSADQDDFGESTYRLAPLSLGAQYDRRRNPLNPKGGYYIDFDVVPYYGISGTKSGILTEVDARGYQSFGEGERFTFAARVQLGSIVGPELLETPTIFRFFSGGGGTVRGQDYQSLAIEDEFGRRTGGRSFFGTSLELRSGVTDAIDVVAFYDYGYVGAESFPDFSGESHAGAGLGVRYNTGIGPLRVDVGTPVSGNTGSSGIYLYIGIGQAF